MSEVQELANVNTLGTKEGLRIIMPIINSNYKYESVYLYGSRGSGTSHLRSDYDFLVIVKLPFLLSAWRKFGLVYQLRRKYQIDLEIISTFALAHSAGGVEFSNWQRESHLVAGKKILPKRSNLTLRQIAINACNMSVRLVRSIELTHDGAKINPYRLRSIVSYMSKDVKITGMPSRWKEIAELVKKEYESENADTARICSAFHDYLLELRPHLRFSSVDNVGFVLSNMLERREFLAHSLLRRNPIQSVLLDSVLALLASLCNRPRDERLIFDYITKLKRYFTMPDYNDPSSAWNALRNVVGRYWDTSARLPFGILIYKRHIIIM